MSSTLTNSCQVTYEIKAQFWTQQFSDECSMETYETMNIQMQHDNFIVRFGCMEVRSGRRTRANVSPLRLKSKLPNAELSKACEGVIPRIPRLWEIPQSRIQITSGKLLVRSLYNYQRLRRPGMSVRRIHRNGYATRMSVSFTLHTTCKDVLALREI